MEEIFTNLVEIESFYLKPEGVIFHANNYKFKVFKELLMTKAIECLFLQDEHY